MQSENNSNPNSDLISTPPPAKQKKPWVTPTIEVLSYGDINKAFASKEAGFPAWPFGGLYQGPHIPANKVRTDPNPGPHNGGQYVFTDVHS